MMRQRLRPMPTADELAAMYAAPHDHTKWQDHIFRVDVTTAIAANLVQVGASVADLSCGDAAIAHRLHAALAAKLVLGDIAPGYPYHGPIEQTIVEIPPVDLFICSETIEHLDDPDKVLSAIRAKTDWLVLSTPDGEDNDENPQHVWGWDAEAVEHMLRAAGFEPRVFTALDLRPAGCTYRYQIWACR